MIQKIHRFLKKATKKKGGNGGREKTFVNIWSNRLALSVFFFLAFDKVNQIANGGYVHYIPVNNLHFHSVFDEIL